MFVFFVWFFFCGCNFCFVLFLVGGGGAQQHRVCIIYLVPTYFIIEYVLFISFLFSLSENVDLHSTLCMCDAVGMSGNWINSTYVYSTLYPRASRTTLINSTYSTKKYGIEVLCQMAYLSFEYRTTTNCI
jgi:hypothetical protein